MIDFFLKTYDKQFDFQTIEKIRRIQFQKIKHALKYAYENSKFYNRLYNKVNLPRHKIKNFEDFKQLPIVTKDDLRKNNWEIPAVHKDKWIDISVTSGTTGKPVYLPWTKRDFQRLANITSILHNIAGIKKADVVQITYPLGAGMWIAGLHNWLGLYKNGVCSLRFGPGFTEAQLQNMRILKPTVVLGSPSFLLKLGFTAREKGILKEIKPRLICVSGENIVNRDFNYNALGNRLVEAWEGTKVKPVYGVSEGPICGTVCDRGRGYHIPSEFFYLEILDIRTHKVLNSGQEGLLAITVFGAETLPLIRYVLGDITFTLEGRCSCGRNSPRLGPILGRVDRLIKFKGLLINPEELANFVAGMEEVESYYLELYKDVNLMDQLRIYVSLKGRKNALYKEKVKDLIKKEIRSHFRINVEIVIKSDEEIVHKTTLDEDGKPRRKPIHFSDLRKQ